MIRKELYDLVWSKPLLTLSKKYKISDVGLRKICLKMDIPLPQSGHWQRVRYGKTVSKKKLPKQFSGDNEIILYHREKDDKGNYSIQSPLNILINEIIKDSNLQHIVPKRLSKPDTLIIQARKTLSNKKPSHYDPLINTFPGELSIRVAPANVPRALRIMDIFIKLVHARGHKLEINYERTEVVIDDVESEVSLREKCSITYQDTWPYRIFNPTDKLIFKMRGYRGNEWMDGKNKRLEDQLPRILATIELRVHELKECWRENELHQKIEEEKLRKEQKERERQEKELNDFNNLIEQANKWQQAKVLRDYLDEYEKRSSAVNKATTETNNWIQWARQKVESYDPFSEM